MKEWLKSGGSSWGSAGSGWGSVRGSSWIPQRKEKNSESKVIIKTVVREGTKNR